MAAIVTDQFRILNANNFVETVENSTNSYYVVVGLANATTPVVGFGRSSDWNTETPNPIDSINYTNHVGDTMSFGKKGVLTKSGILYVREDTVVSKNTQKNLYS